MEENTTLLEQSLLNSNPHLYVVKSISKSYGVPGLRLGILASGDAEAIATMKKDVAIWNINSFAEFYMQIYEKYKSAYAAGLTRFYQTEKRNLLRICQRFLFYVLFHLRLIMYFVRLQKITHQPSLQQSFWKIIF